MNYIIRFQQENLSMHLASDDHQVIGSGLCYAIQVVGLLPKMAMTGHAGKFGGKTSC